MYHIFFVFRSTLAHLRPKMVFSKQTFHSMAAHLGGTASPSESRSTTQHYFTHICVLLIVPHPRLPTDFSRPIQVDLPISHAGAFVYWVEYDGDVPGERVKGREGYFNIDPILRTKSRTPILSDDLTPLPPSSGAVLQSEYVNLPLDGLSILTVVSKWMGPVYEWRRHFKEAKDRGYTMLHYTPLQERGESNSPYSIRDQMKYDPEMLDGKREADGGKGAVEGILKIAREEYGLLSLTDVVLNHTANDSPWLVEHPEAGRPLDNPRRCWNLHHLNIRLQSRQFSTSNPST